MIEEVETVQLKITEKWWGKICLMTHHRENIMGKKMPNKSHGVPEGLEQRHCEASTKEDRD